MPAAKSFDVDLDQLFFPELKQPRLSCSFSPPLLMLLSLANTTCFPLGPQSTLGLGDTTCAPDLRKDLVVHSRFFQSIPVAMVQTLRLTCCCTRSASSRTSRTSGCKLNAIVFVQHCETW